MRLVFASLLFSTVASAADLSVQVRLLDGTGTPLQGAHDVVVRIVDAATPSPGEPVCHDEVLSATVFASGYASLRLADVEPDCAQGERWVAFEVGGQELGPRHALSAVPHALTADHVRGYVDLPVVAGLAAEGSCAPDGRIAVDAADGVQVCTAGQWVRIAPPANAFDGSSQATASQSCRVLHQTHPELTTGVYWIDPDYDGDRSDAWQAYCDMSRTGGGWTLVMQNIQSVTPNPAPSFVQSTTQNTLVGGPLDSLGSFDLLVALDEWNEIGQEARMEVGFSPGVPERQALYQSIVLTGSTYTLNLAGQTVTIGSSSPGIFAGHNGQDWTTYDRDNDTSSNNCAVQYGNQPWWYTACWSGSMWGYNRNEGARWVNSDGVGAAIQRPWGALWIR